MGRKVMILSFSNKSLENEGERKVITESIKKNLKLTMENFKIYFKLN